jgi:alcohol dehydrogenase class IV
VETIMANMDRYLSGDPDAARAIMDAANRAGQAINITQTTAPHAFSYKLTSLYSLPHGHAVALCLPPIWRYMLANGSRCTDPRGWEHLQRVFESISHAMQCNIALDAVSLFQSLLSKLGMQRPHTDTPERDLTLLSQTVNPVRLKNSPVAIDQTAAYAIYKTILL